jgi:hypothetical protein
MCRNFGREGKFDAAEHKHTILNGNNVSKKLSIPKKMSTVGVLC